MTNKQPDQIAWVDVETTGIFAEGGRILELGIIITTLDLSEIAREWWLVYASPAHLAALPREVLQMHQRSGLIPAVSCADPRKNDASAVQFLATAMLAKHCTSPPILAGYRVAFDRRWLHRWMPIFEANLSEYTLDVSCLRQVMSALGHRTPPRNTATHRTLDDCQCALDEMRGYSIAPLLARHTM